MMTRMFVGLYYNNINSEIRMACFYEQTSSEYKLHFSELKFQSKTCFLAHVLLRHFDRAKSELPARPSKLKRLQRSDRRDKEASKKSQREERLAQNEQSETHWRPLVIIATYLFSPALAPAPPPFRTQRRWRQRRRGRPLHAFRSICSLARSRCPKFW